MERKERIIKVSEFKRKNKGVVASDDNFLCFEPNFEFR